jgi:Ca2+-binding RTX toxin-like protein
LARISAILVMAGSLIGAFGAFATAVTKNRERGGAGPNRMVGTSEHDALCGEDGNDALAGGANNDDIFGEDGNDKLKGGKGGDDLDGNPGDDVLRPGMFNQTEDGARDRISCGDGTDVGYVTGWDVVAGDCETRRR